MVAGNGNRAAAASQSPEAVTDHALQVIILGSGGGPREDNTTAFLVRSIAANWKEGSLLAVDAGVHLSAIAKILKQTKDSPFASLPLPHPSTLTNSANANAAYITSELVRTYLITHPHLDHISGFVVNTAFKQENPKYLAALPVTLEAFRNHIFNDVIWPNLSDENDGPGVVKYMELVEGGSELSRHLEGYVPICEGLSVRAFAVSHGRHGHRVLNGKQKGSAMLPPAGNDARMDNNGLIKTKCSYDSSAFFIRDESGASGKEVLVFGDVEPDSIAHEPRNKEVWKEAASKVASGKLGGILIECSFDDSVKEKDLFGHMAPKFLIAELKVLATEVTMNRKGTSSNRNGSPLNMSGADLKRKRRESGDYDHSQPTAQRRRSTSPSHLGSNVQTAQELPGKATANNGSSSISPPPDKFYNEPLKGIKIVIIHIKERLQVGVDESAVILRQLREYEGEVGLGCEFIISKVGESVYF